MPTPQSFEGRTAIVTGGGSGIGAALGARLVAHGAHVVLADVDGDAATATAARVAGDCRPGGSVVARHVDVRDRAAVSGLVDEVVERAGALDYLFNNAGISMGGPTHELTGDHWDLTIEVNVRGVVNGILAAYPRMVAQGHGHIVNTASGAGLAAPPLVVPYAMTKHAVVGLTAGLRPEAALHGVRVSVLCPGAVETPLLDRLPPGDLPPTASAPVTARRYLERMRQRPMAADRFADAALRAISRNRAVVVLPRSARVLWYAQRLSPALVGRVTRRMAATAVADLLRPAADPDDPPGGPAAPVDPHPHPR